MLRPVAILALLLALGAPAPWVRADVDEDHDAPDPAWQLLPSDVGARISLRRRIAESTPQGPLGYERLAVSCPPGYSGNAAFVIPQARMHDALRAKVVTRSSEPGLQIAARVVLPRSLDSRTGRPLTTLVMGARYNTPGQWQTLELAGLPKLVAWQARVLRDKDNKPADPREAYVDAVVLLVPGGQNPTVVDIDHLTVQGVVEVGTGSTGPEGAGPELGAPGETTRYEPLSITLAGPLVTVDGQPMLPRLLEHHGEGFDLVARLGFNGVWMVTTPTAAQIREAERHRLWIVCPAPADAQALAAIRGDSPWRAVLAWHLGEGLSAVDIDGIGARADDLRLAEDRFRRPLLAGVGDHYQAFSRVVDGLVIDLRSPAVSRGFDDWGGMLRGVNRNARPGTPVWAAVPVGLPAAHTEQLQALGVPAAESRWVDPRDIHTAAMAAVCSGARGLVFRTGGRVSTGDGSARGALLACELLNRELAIIEPWIVRGRSVAASSSVGTSLPVAAMLQLDRTWLALPRPAEVVLASQSGRAILPGVPETSRVFRLTSCGIRELLCERSMGRVTIATDALHPDAMLLATDDLNAAAQVRTRCDYSAQRAVLTERELAQFELAQLDTTNRRLPSDRRHPGVTSLAPLVSAMLSEANLALARRDIITAHDTVREARHRLGQASTLLTAAARDPQLAENLPTQYPFAALPHHLALQQTLAALPRTENRLPGGDFENLDQMRLAGWQHLHAGHSPLIANLQLVGDAPRDGQLVARFVTTALPGRESQANDSPAAWISSPVVTAEPGEIVEITGWARLVATDPASDARLLVFDSVAGPALSTVVSTDANWRKFRLVRCCGPTGKLQVTFAVQGVGQADLDAIAVQGVVRPPRRLPATGEPESPAETPDDGTGRIDPVARVRKLIKEIR